MRLMEKEENNRRPVCLSRLEAVFKWQWPKAWLCLLCAFFIFQEAPGTGRADVESGYQERTVLALFDSTEPFNGREDYNLEFGTFQVINNANSLK